MVARFVVVLALALWANFGVAGGQLHYRQASDGLFEIVSDEGDNLSLLADLAEVGLRVAQANFGPFPRPPHPIVLRSVAQTDIEDAPLWLVRVEADRSVLVALQWNSQTRLKTVCEGISAGLLTILQSRGGGDGALPLWMVFALADEMRMAVRPASIDALVIQARDQGLAPLESMMKLRVIGDSTNRIRLSSLWLLRLLKRGVRGAEERHRFLRSMIVADDWRPFFDRALAVALEVGDDGQRERLWALGFQRLVRERQPAFADMSASSRRLQWVASPVVSIGNADHRLDVELAWDYRNLASVRAAATLVVEEIKLDVLRCNPVFRNALLSTGLAWEAVLNEDKPAFEAAVGQLAKDRRAALQTMELVERLLD